MMSRRSLLSYVFGSAVVTGGLLADNEPPPDRRLRNSLELMDG